MKKSIICGIIFLGITAFIISIVIITPHTLPKQNANLRTIEDMAGNKIKIPCKVQRVVTAMYPLATQLVFLTGAQDKLAGVSDFDINSATKRIYTQIENIYRPVRYAGGDITVEEILKMNPDVLLLSKRNPQNANLRKLGIPTVSFDMKQEMKKFYTVCYGYTHDNQEIAKVLGE